jgi:hypothetical protein
MINELNERDVRPSKKQNQDNCALDQVVWYNLDDAARRGVSLAWWLWAEGGSRVVEAC